MSNVTTETVRKAISSATTLRELAAALRETRSLDPDERDQIDWSDLPNFGGPVPVNTAGVWSWDDANLLVGTCADDLEIVARSARPRGYTTYSRDESGIVTRTHGIVTLTDNEREAEYPHAETLMGWTEVQVFWTRETGPAVGVAPR